MFAATRIGVMGGGSDERDPYFNNVSLLLHGNGTNGSTSFVDSSTNNHTITPYGNAQISTAQAKFGGASMYFDGNGDYLSLPPSIAQWGNASDAFSIEAYVYHVGRSSASNLYQSQSIVAKGGVYLNFGIDGSGKLTFTHSGGSQRSLQSSSVVALNSWTHVAATASGGSLRLFINGVLDGTGTFYGIDSSGLSEATQIGVAPFSGCLNFNGYIDDLRITKGVARYTANFTPPTRQFPDR